MRTCQIGYRTLGAALIMAGLLGTSWSPALADIVPPNNASATLTADNHYALYVGNEDGSLLTYIGRNEATATGDPGDFNWSLPESFNFSIAAGQYIYVVAWDETQNPSSPQMWIGQFSLPDGSKLYSNTTDWYYTVGSRANPGDNTDPPSNAYLSSDIAGASWASPGAVASNGDAPWSTIPEFDSSAKIIWADGFDLDGSPTSTNDTYVIFRSQAAVVPIPASVLLIGSGLVRLGLMCLRRRRE